MLQQEALVFSRREMGTPKSGHTFKNTSVAPRSLAFWFGPASFSGAQLFEELLCTFHCHPLIQMVGGRRKKSSTMVPLAVH